MGARNVIFAYSRPLVLAFGVVTGCGIATEDVSNDEAMVGAAPSEPMPVPGNESFYWASSSYEDFWNVQPPVPFRHMPAVADSDPIAQRLQTWVDAVHALVSADVQRATGRALVAPKPILKIVPAKASNGWVSYVPVCLGPARIDGPAGRPEREAANLILRGGGAAEPLVALGERTGCLQMPREWGADLGKYAKWFSARKTTCKLKKDGADMVVGGAGCANESTPTRASRVAVQTTSPYVHITSQLVEDTAEEVALVTVLAHELGHYYEAHAITNGLELGANYNYWFRPTSPLTKGRPKRLPESDAIEASAGRLLFNRFGRIEGQKLSRRLSELLLEKLPPLLASSACAEAATKAAAVGVSNLYVPYATGPQKEAFLAYETSLLACAKNLTLGARGAPTLDAVKEALPWELRNADIAGAATLEDVLTKLDSLVAPTDREEDALRARVDEEHLGRFTFEQSADDFSLRWTAALGFDPMGTIGARVRLEGVLGATTPGEFEFRNRASYEKCAALFTSGFMEGGHPVFIPLGFDLLESHHSECHRIFNYWARQQAERFIAAPAALSPLPEGQWTALRVHAKALTATVKDHSGPEPQRAPKGTMGGLILD